MADDYTQDPPVDDQSAAETNRLTNAGQPTAYQNQTPAETNRITSAGDPNAYATPAATPTATTPDAQTPSLDPSNQSPAETNRLSNLNSTIAAIRSSQDSGVQKDFIGKILDSFVNGMSAVNDFGKSNKDNPLLAAALTGIGTAQKNQFAKEQAATQQQYAQERLAQQAQIAKDIVNQNSVVSAPRVKGIIGGALTRNGGAAVYNANGKLVTN